MNNEKQISSANDWLALPEPQLPVLGGAEEQGSIYEFQRVGALFISSAETKECGIDASEIIPGRCLLPTAVVLFAGSWQFCRLPADLGPWVAACLAMAKEGKNPFPGKVELGVLGQRIYAEFL